MGWPPGGGFRLQCRLGVRNGAAEDVPRNGEVGAPLRPPSGRLPGATLRRSPENDHAPTGSPRSTDRPPVSDRPALKGKGSRHSDHGSILESASGLGLASGEARRRGSGPRRRRSAACPTLRVRLARLARWASCRQRNRTAGRRDAWPDSPARPASESINEHGRPEPQQALGNPPQPL